MDFQENFSPNLSLNYSETLSNNKDGSINYVRFFFIFYGKSYCADLSKQNVENDWSTVLAEGDADLFDSFVNQLEDKYWEKMKECFNKHVDAEKDDEDEGFDSTSFDQMMNEPFN